MKNLELILFLLKPLKLNGKVEKKNDVVQGRLINDIKRFNIMNYSELNDFFNNTYISYLN